MGDLPMTISLHKLPSHDGLLHLLTLLLELLAKGTRPLVHAEELFLLQEQIVVPIRIVILREISP